MRAYIGVPANMWDKAVVGNEKAREYLRKFLDGQSVTNAVQTKEKIDGDRPKWVTLDQAMDAGIVDSVLIDNKVSRKRAA